MPSKNYIKIDILLWCRRSVPKWIKTISTRLIIINTFVTLVKSYYHFKDITSKSIGTSSDWQSTTGDDWETLNFRKIHLLPKEKCVEQLGTQKARHNLKNSMHFRLLHAPRTTLISGWPTRSRSASCENVGKFVEDTVGSIETNCLLSPFAESARESDMEGERGRQMPKRQLK